MTIGSPAKTYSDWRIRLSKIASSGVIAALNPQVPLYKSSKLFKNLLYPAIEYLTLAQLSGEEDGNEKRKGFSAGTGKTTLYESNDCES